MCQHQKPAPEASTRSLRLLRPCRAVAISRAADEESESAPMARPMTYEQYLDEVSTLLTEIYTMEDDAAIQMVMRAQADDFFSGHDDDPSLCTQERAERDVRQIFKSYPLKPR